jgi:hypothetical protein
VQHLVLEGSLDASMVRTLLKKQEVIEAAVDGTARSDARRDNPFEEPYAAALLAAAADARESTPSPAPTGYRAADARKTPLMGLNSELGSGVRSTRSGPMQVDVQDTRRARRLNLASGCRISGQRKPTEPARCGSHRVTLSSRIDWTSALRGD